MAILNYTTTISFEKTIMEIQKCLVEHGATKITTDYKDGVPTALTFCLELNGNLAAFALPADFYGVLSCMKDTKNIRIIIPCCNFLNIWSCLIRP